MSICAENITEGRQKVIVNGVSLKVSRGETVGLLGLTAAANRPFAYLAGLRRPDSGSVSWTGRTFPASPKAACPPGGVR